MRLFSTKLFIILTCCFAALTASAADFYARGVAHCILDDGSGNFPIDEAGEVFVGTTPDEVPVWAAGTNASSIVTGPMAGGQASVKFYYWARAKEGYTFLGWGSTKTSKTVTSGTDRLEGQPWESSYTLWSAGSAAAPKEVVRYAIFRKNAAEDTTGGGVKLKNVTGNTHIFGSTTGEWSVHLNYQVPLAYRDFAGYADGYGTDKGLISAITCTEKTNGTTVSVKNARVSGSPTADGTDAYGLVFFPADMPVGTYSVHVPKGLFTTSLGMVTAAADFDLTITPDETPFTIDYTSPDEGYSWDASEATQTKETDGNFSTITLTFNKNIARVNTEGKEIVLTNTTTGQKSPCLNCSISATTNKRLGVIVFDQQATGNYTFTLPANVFFDASGNGNEATTLHFSIVGSKIEPWTLPTYSFTASPANFSTVDILNRVSFTLHREGYTSPTAIVSPLLPEAALVTEVYDPDVDYSDPDARPTINSEAIKGLSLSLRGNVLTVTFTEPVRSKGKVVVNVPAGIVRNIAANNAYTARQLYEMGGCTNSAMQVTINVTPTSTEVETLSADPETKVEAFTIDGRRVSPTYSSTTSARQQGLRIIRTTSPNGEVKVRKVLQK